MNRWDNYSDELYHHGVLGMRWGVRNEKTGGGTGGSRYGKSGGGSGGDRYQRRTNILGGLFGALSPQARDANDTARMQERADVERARAIQDAEDKRLEEISRRQRHNEFRRAQQAGMEQLARYRKPRKREIWQKSFNRTMDFYRNGLGNIKNRIRNEINEWRR